MTTNNPQAKEPPSRSRPFVGVVGPCASGKTTLIAGLSGLGYDTRQIAQEHSYVQDMWKRITDPEVLIFLDASYPVTCQRRKLNWTEAEYTEQKRRLAHAREHADFYLNTDGLTIEQVLEQAVQFIRKRRQTPFTDRQ